MSEKTIEVVDHLVALFPVLKPAFDEHLSDNFGEVLPHLFLGDVARYLTNVSSALSRETDADRRKTAKIELESFMAEIEKLLARGDDEIDELIVVSLLENLPRQDEDVNGLRSYFGPRLRNEATKMEKWKPE